MNIDYDTRFFAAVHEQLQDDAAYVWSVERHLTDRASDAVFNMSLVLRAHGFDYTTARTFAQLDYAAQQEQN